MVKKSRGGVPESKKNILKNRENKENSRSAKWKCSKKSKNALKLPKNDQQMVKLTQNQQKWPT